MDQIVHDVRRQNWLNIINQCQQRPADISVHKWLAENGVKEKAYYYWLRKIRKEAFEAQNLPATTSSGDVSFVEVPLPAVNTENSFTTDYKNSASVIIHKNDMTIEIKDSVSKQLLSLLLQEVARA